MASLAQPKKYTCIACRLMFNSSDAQRDHYKTDYHRFNLKRQVADLAPVSFDAFQKKMEAIKAGETQTTVVGDCQVCNKRFQSQGAAEQHVKSKKHKEAVAAAAAKKPVGEKHTVPEHIRQQIRTKQAGQQVPVQDSKAAAAMPVPAPKVEESNSADAATATSTVTVTDVPEEKEKTQEELLDERIQNAIRLTELDCLFCTHKADDFEGNMTHMTRAHSFFIPDVEYLKDLRGLIKYLGEKITIGYTCLWCNGKGRGFHSAEGVRGHMRDLSHCKLDYEDQEDEYNDFYDYDALEADRKIASDTPAEVTVDGELLLANRKILGNRETRLMVRKERKPRDYALMVSLAKEYQIMQAKQEQRKAHPSKHLLQHNANLRTKVGLSANNQAHFRHQTPK